MVGPPLDHGPWKKRVAPTSSPGTPRGSIDNTSAEAYRVSALACPEKKLDWRNCPNVHRALRCTSQRFTDSFVPAYTRGNPPPFGLKTSEYSRPGPHRCGAVENPNTTRLNSTSREELPRSMRWYALL